MTGTDIREALRAVADATDAPAPDRLDLQRRVRHERRRRTTARVGVAAAVAGVAAVAGTFMLSLPGPEAATGRQLPTGQPTGQSDPPRAGDLGVDLQTPVAFVVDGRLQVLDPAGASYDLDVDVEEVVGYTSENIWAVGAHGDLLRFTLQTSGDGPGGRWTIRGSDDVPIDGRLNSIELSADGRWLGWIDKEGRLVVEDLKGGSAAGPVQVGANTYLADLQQGTGAALVAGEGGSLVLRALDGPVPIPVRGDSFGLASTASRSLVAVVDRDDRTRVYDVTDGSAHLVATVPGSGYLAPYGDALATVENAAGPASRALLWLPDTRTTALDVPGRPIDVAWADDDTVLVATWLDQGTEVYGCDTVGEGRCARLPVDGAGDVTFAH